MLKEKTYVRCPIEYGDNPRDFAIGQITKIDSYAKKVSVTFYDVNNVDVYYSKPEDMTIDVQKVIHCRAKNNSYAIYNGNKVRVLAHKINKDDEFFYYYIKNKNDEIILVCEKDLELGFNDGFINPIKQLLSFEFQNPRWYLGRTIVSKAMNNINNSLYGFKELAGCKISLKSYQLKTVMRCLQNDKCRYMIADEVGLGKTIEAISVLKVYLNEKYDMRCLICVPDGLVSQWKTELAFKFKLFTDFNENNNKIDLIGMSDLSKYSKVKYDFIIFDEVHRFLQDEVLYNNVLSLSKISDNIIMLSATPLQKRNDEYKKLLTLIQPEKYEAMSEERFNNLLEQQSKLIRKIFNALDEFDSMVDTIDLGDDSSKDEIYEYFEAVVDELDGISRLINDEYYNKLLEKIEFDSKDYGVKSIQNAVAYVCENFQLEKSIIRNRRKNTSYDDNEINIRELVDLSYEVDNDFNNDEWNSYISFSNWLENDYDKSLDFSKDILPVVYSLFSSASAFCHQLNILSKKVDLSEELIKYSARYLNFEKNVSKNIMSYLDDPEEASCKIVNIIDYLDQECDDKKVILFTNFDQTFELYKDLLIKVFGKDKLCFFNKNMTSDELELNSYRFQTLENYSILLSDESGGEGRNFQNADLLIHIDIPWSANDIEQRIGRLDRIGRKKGKNVISIVCYGKDTLESDLFKLWNDGLNIFSKSQSGLEIIMNDIDRKIIESLQDSFKYGLGFAKKDMDDLIKNQTDALRKEQVFDIAAYQYQNINKILDDTIDKFSENETKLFGDAMMGWASLSGFNGTKESNDIVTFTASSMSFGSLRKTMFVPPDMMKIINDKLNQLRNHVRILNSENIMNCNTSYIRGTFSRETALKNDYLNFFAPSDEIFDSITNNALDSYKGTCAAFSIPSKIKWIGLVFVWKLQIDQRLIYDKHVTEHLIDQYRGYIPSNQFITIYTIDNFIDENVVINEFNRIVFKDEKSKNKVKHLGKRDDGSIERFKSKYKGNWESIVEEAQNKAKTDAKNKANLLRKSMLQALKRELMNLLSAQKAIANFYGSSDCSEKMESVNSDIFEIISKSILALDSVCYVEMNNNE